MADRLGVIKTPKLFVGGKFSRSESGRSIEVAAASGKVISHACRASRKDLRDAVVAARSALDGWRNATAYLRGQILYRVAEMLEARRDELIDAVEAVGPSDPSKKPATKAGQKRSARKLTPAAEVDTAIDRLLAYAGWTDKVSAVLGGANPVAGPYYNFTIPEPVGVVGVLAPDEPSLLGLVSLIAPALCVGSTVVAVAGDRNPLVALPLAEACATGDVPAGVVNLLTGLREELAPVMASHRDIDAVHACGVGAELARALREGSAENLKRVTVRESVDWLSPECEGPSWLEPMLEMKTVWHPSAT